MIDVIRGAFDKPISTKQLIESLQKLDLEQGTLYTGYPIIGSIDNKKALDAIFITPNYGMILFDIVEESQTSERDSTRNEIYNSMFSRLIGVKGLSEKRGRLNFNLTVLTYAPAWPERLENDDEELIINDDHLKKILYQLEDQENKTNYNKILQAIQAITKLKQRPQRIVQHATSKGSILNIVEKSISNLDSHQSKAVIETALGIQRIRGLAGSGKTVILALKAAYLHSKYPEWKIGVTFYSRALKSQFKDLITKFTIEHKNEEPDWDKIKIMQAWGSPSDEGIYYNFCKINGREYYNYDQAITKYGRAEALEKISEEALISTPDPKADFDLILIDEAQDFSESFLRLCYNLVKPSDPNNVHNRRLVYAYDELQKLNDLSLRSPKEIFGEGIDFTNDLDKARQDVILQVCYRNSGPVLVTAHGLGFGIYRQVQNQVKLVTMFQEKQLWKDVGYKVVGGTLDLGSYVELARDSDTSPELMKAHVTIDDIIKFQSFNTVPEQNNWIADEIAKNIKEDELDYKDIIVIAPNALTAKSDTALLRSVLMQKGITSHLVGVSTSPDDFFMSQSIAFTSIYRAKGNEAAMVYIMNTDYCFQGLELIKKRNILFTAITRSKGWVRACGVGDAMIGLSQEFDKIKQEQFQLNFQYPTEDEMNRLNIIHRELSGIEKKKISEGQDELKSLLGKLESREIRIEDLTEEDLNKLKALINDAK